MAASSNGETRKQEAAWLMWCSAKRMGPRYGLSSRRMIDGTHSFSLIHTGIAFRNEPNERGKVAM